MSVCKIEDVLDGQEALISEQRIAGLIGVIAESEIRRQTTSQVRADLCSRSTRGVDEYRTMADVAIIIGASLISVVGLGKTPDIMVSDGLRISTANSYLVIEGLCVVVPHTL